MSTPRSAAVHVPVTVLWRSPTSPRRVDAPMLAAQPDHQAWLAAMDGPAVPREDARIGLLDRIESQVVRDEPVTVLEQDREWSQVVVPWQPHGADDRGYPGFVRTAHLRDGEPGPRPHPAAAVEADRLLDASRAYLGLPYLWGGTCETALDCSGLIHLVCRAHGLVVPRDAGDQQDECLPVELGTELPGDLYFFAHPGKPVHHVGFVTGTGRMVHAPGTGSRIVEEPLSKDRRDTLVAAGRLPGVRVAG